MPARAELIARVAVGGTSSEAAADALIHQPLWVSGAPPPALIDALTDPAAAANPALRRVALAWERGALNAAMLDAARGATTTARAEAAAQLLKDTLDEHAAPAAVELARAPRTPGPVRRWLAEGLARLAAGRVVGWRQLAELVEALAADADPAARGGAVGLLMALPPTATSTDVLLRLAGDDDAEVLAGALRALTGEPGAVSRLDPARLRALLDHPHPLVRSRAEDLAALIEDPG
jgi:hypothetical protein